MVRKWCWEFHNYSKTKLCMKNYLCAAGSLKDHEPLCAPVLLNFAQKQDFEWLKFICVNLILQTGRVFSNPTDQLFTGKKITVPNPKMKKNTNTKPSPRIDPTSTCTYLHTLTSLIKYTYIFNLFLFFTQ